MCMVTPSVQHSYFHTSQDASYNKYDGSVDSNGCKATIEQDVLVPQPLIQYIVDTYE